MAMKGYHKQWPIYVRFGNSKMAPRFSALLLKAMCNALALCMKWADE